MTKLDKPIIHFKVPMEINPKLVINFQEKLNNTIGDKVYLIVTPFDMQVYNTDGVQVNTNEITLKEFLDQQEKYIKEVKND